MPRTNAGLIHLTGLTKLKKLYLDGTPVADAGLVHLKGLTELETLSMDETQVTEVGVAEPKKALPKCDIRWP